jgi:hypothetical protein
MKSGDGKDMKNNYDFTDEQNLMYLLIFGDKSEYEIDIFKYIDNMKEINPFIEKTLTNLKKSGVKIIEDILILTENKNSWIIKIEK